MSPSMSVPLKVYRVSVDLASAWLSTSRQEKIKPEKVALYSAAIVNGRWDTERHTNDPVKFWDGRLINGNHRLHAVIDCGESADMWVLGEPPKGD